MVRFDNKSSNWIIFKNFVNIAADVDKWEAVTREILASYDVTSPGMFD